MQKTKNNVEIKIKRFIVSSSQTDLIVKDIAALKTVPFWQFYITTS